MRRAFKTTFVEGIHGCQIDYSFLIDPKIRAVKMKSERDDKCELLFSRSMQPLKKILDNDRLKPSITHPVLASFINLKSTKFRTMFNMNFYIFLFFFTVRIFQFYSRELGGDFIESNFNPTRFPSSSS
jgi:hypothetical protein